MKIKEICAKTGLTDRTVRYYIEEGLISPVYTENYLGRKSFDFSEEDLERLRNIATLRSFGFSVEEIKKLTSSEKSSRELVEAVRQRSEESLSESRRRLDVLSALEKSDDADLSKLAEELEKLRAGGSAKAQDAKAHSLHVADPAHPAVSADRCDLRHQPEVVLQA